MDKYAFRRLAQRDDALADTAERDLEARDITGEDVASMRSLPPR